MKDISKQILDIVFRSICVVIILLGIISMTIIERSTMSTLKKSIKETTKIAANDIHNSLEKYTIMVTEIANNPVFTADYDMMIAKRTEVLNDAAKRNDLIKVTFADKDGLTIDGYDLSDREYFQRVKSEKKAVISELIVSKINNELTISFAAPVISDNEFKGAIVAVASATVLSDIVKSIQVGEDGSCYILNGKGTVIADHEEDIVFEEFNAIESSKENSTLKKLASIEGKMIKGETGIEMYKSKSGRYMLSYAPINIANNWSIGLLVRTKEFLTLMYVSGFLILVIMAAVLLISKKYISKFSLKITEPIDKCVQRIKLLSQGDLNSEVEIIENSVESYELTKATYDTIEELKSIIGDLSDKLKNMSDKNFNISMDKEYNGDFVEIKSSINNIIQSLNGAFEEIKEATYQVNSGAVQVSDTAQTLSKGASEQAGVIEEVSASIEQINEQVKQTAGNAGITKNITLNLVKDIEDSSAIMNEMLNAMNEIEKASNNISEVISVINSISDQTNLLALNAAIEAARAGELGKGFAVVAEEVRVLSGETTNAVNETVNLVKNAIDAVNRGKALANDTSESLKKVVDNTQVAMDSIESIVSATEEQAQSIDEINAAMDRITEVVQSNSAISEESAAASEELTAQSESLNEIIDTFNLL